MRSSGDEGRRHTRILNGRINLGPAPHCLRILAPGDVIPKGAVTRSVMADGSLGDEHEQVSARTVSPRATFYVLMSLPKPETIAPVDVRGLVEEIIDDMTAFAVLLRKRIEEVL